MSFDNSIKELLKKGGLSKNDKVLLHSNIKPFYKFLINEGYKFDLSDLTDCILDYLSPNGTLVVPSFNFDFCKTGFYSAKKTVSQMGVLSETFRKLAKNFRTWHPVYSFSLHGNVPINYLEFKNYSAFGKNSMFEWIKKNDGKIAILDLPDQKSMTFYHHVEEDLDVDWRFHKKFYGEYIDYNGVMKKNAYAKIFVRKISKKFTILTDVHKMQNILFDKNLYNSSTPGKINGLRSINSNDLYNEVKNVIASNRAEGILYKKI